MANAAAAVQLEDDAEPADAEPWVLEGWGDGPSVSEVAQQAALRMGPYVKNVPTTLVGLGAGGGRRVLSAGHQSRGQLKVSEARRKAGPAGPSYSQGDRRASGPAALAAGSQPATATVRRTAMQRTLDVGDESDVEPTAYMSAGGSGGMPSSHSQALPQSSQAHNRITPAQRAGAGLRQQNAQQVAQSAVNAATRLGGRREATAGTSTATVAVATHASSLAAAGSGYADLTSGGSRGGSAETHLPGTHSGGAASGTTARVPNVSVRGVPPGSAGSGSPSQPVALGAHGHPPLPPQHPPTHLEPLSAVVGRGPGTVDRPASGPHADGPHARTPSFSPCSASQPSSLHDHHQDSFLSPVFIGAAQVSPMASPALTPGPPGGPALLLPGLHIAGRRGNSVRADGNGLSGWDPEAPAVQSHSPLGPSPSAASSNVSLWIGITATGAGMGGSGLQPQAPGAAAAASGSGRGSPLAGAQPGPRRDGCLRNQRGPGCASSGLLDLSLGPERSLERAGQALAAPPSSVIRAGRPQGGGPLLGGSSSRSGSPDVVAVAVHSGAPAGFSAPQQDALTEFCASRAELGSAGTGSISGAVPVDGGRGHAGGSPGGGLQGITVPLRVPSLTKTTVGRVS